MSARGGPVHNVVTRQHLNRSRATGCSLRCVKRNKGRKNWKRERKNKKERRKVKKYEIAEEEIKWEYNKTERNRRHKNRGQENREKKRKAEKRQEDTTRKYGVLHDSAVQAGKYSSKSVPE